MSVEQILPTLATKADLREAFETARRHTDVRVEDVRDDIRKVAEGVASLSTSLRTNTRLLEDVVRRLGHVEDRLERVEDRFPPR